GRTERVGEADRTLHRAHEVAGGDGRGRRLHPWRLRPGRSPRPARPTAPAVRVRRPECHLLVPLPPLLLVPALLGLLPCLTPCPPPGLLLGDAAPLLLLEPGHKRRDRLLLLLQGGQIGGDPPGRLLQRGQGLLLLLAPLGRL